MIKFIFRGQVDNAVGVVLGLLAKLQLKVSHTSVRDVLKSHPEYPSLLSISDSLTQWHIPNEAYQLEPHQLTTDIFPIVAHLRTEGGRFILMKDSSDTHFIYDDETGKNQRIEKRAFYQQWSGTVLLSEANEQSGEPGYTEIRMKEIVQRLKPFVVVAVTLSLIFIFLISHPVQQPVFFYSLLFCKAIGLFISILLLIQGLDEGNPFVKNLCSLSKKNKCNAILKSEASRITEWLSWSEVGFMYFSFTFVILLLNTYFKASGINACVGVLSLLCLPYSIYSIYYQSQVARQWCTLWGYKLYFG